MESGRQLRLRLNRIRRGIAATLGFCLSCVLLLGGTLHGLDPNKHVTQYIHNSWRIQDHSAPNGMASIGQTSDGFLWLTSLSKRMYRFDGIRFLPWALSVDGKNIDRFVTVYGDHADGLWALDSNNEIVHVKKGLVTSHFVLKDSPLQGGISEDGEGRIVGCARRLLRHPTLLRHGPRSQVFGKVGWNVASFRGLASGRW
jgi:hypothetical protein